MKLIYKTLSQSFFSCLAFVASNSLYFVNNPDGESPHLIFNLFAITLIQGALCYYLYKKGLKKNILQFIFITAVLSRAIVLFSSPILEDDHYRYRWDGHVLSHGINPYNFAPSSEKLDHLHTEYREKVGYLTVPTIYPPLAEYTFALNSLIFSGTLVGLKLIFIFFDLMTGFLIIIWLKARGLNPIISIFYLLNPLVIKEVANSAHLDSILAFFFTLSVFLLDNLSNNYKSKLNLKPRWAIELLCSISLAFASLIKLVPIFYLPELIKRSQKKWLSFLVFILTLFILSLPLLFGDKFMNGLGSFAKLWFINESLFYPISYLSTQTIYALNLNEFALINIGLINEIPGKMVSGFLLFLVMLYSLLKRAKPLTVDKSALLIIVSLLLLSPVFNPWYVLWFLPFSIVAKHPPTILLSFLLPLSYSWYIKDYYQWLRALEYFVFFSYLLFWHWRQHQISKQSI